QAWGYVADIVDHEFHQQHAVSTDIRQRYAHIGIGEPEQGIHLGVLPEFFLHLATVARAFFHGPRLSAVLHFAAVAIRGRLAKTALLGIFVDFGAADGVATAHDVYRRFLAAHQLTDHFIDEAL